MTERALYCHPVDCLRKFDPTLTESDLDNNNYIGNSDREQVRARIDAVGNELEEKTGEAWRLRRVGAKGASETYEHQGVDGKRNTEPLRATLDHQDILPLDSNSDDVLEVRTGRDSWRDITDQAGDEFVLDHDDGTLKLYRILIQRIRWGVPDDRYIRLSYRYGALGGDPERGGQTTLDGGVSQGDTSIDVTNAARLPADGILLINNSEYVRLTDINYSADTVTVTRGKQATTDEGHSDGNVVHYCPESVRDAVAGKVAAELVRYDNIVDELPTPDDNVSHSDKIDDWQQEWESVLSGTTGVRLL
jgi:hypothetical protein